MKSNSRDVGCEDTKENTISKIIYLYKYIFVQTLKRELLIHQMIYPNHKNEKM